MNNPIKVNISKKVFNTVYVPYLDNEDRYLVFYGGGSSGKSYFIVQRYIYKILKQKINLLVVRQTGDTNRNSTFALFKQIIYKWHLESLFDITDLRIKCKNGNEIIFKGLDNSEKTKSTTFDSGELTDIWIEEATECNEKDVNQLKVRLRGGTSKKQMVLSFNPININHWIKRHFIDSKLATVCFSTYKENKFLTEEDRQVLESFQQTDPYYYQVYALGQWGVLGQTVFDSNKINNRLQTISSPLKIGYFSFDYDDTLPSYGSRNQITGELYTKNKISNIKWTDDKNGIIKIYEVPDSPIVTSYGIGGDTAGEGSDYFTAHVINKATGKQSAVLRTQTDSDLYARQMYCLGMYYKQALIGIESNFDSYPIKELERLGYPSQYIREQEDKYTHKLEKAYGFRTTSITRPSIISELVQVVREHSDWINDKDTLEEMLTFIRNEKGRPEAQLGAHDDLVMGLAIAYRIMEQVKEIQQPIYNKLKDDFNLYDNFYKDYGEKIEII